MIRSLNTVNEKPKLKVLELFGGIGACSKALMKNNVNYEIADYVEIDKYAVKTFNAIHRTHFEPQDICSWDKDMEVDLIMHGSPCQDFSMAGDLKGGDEGSGTRSSLMYETLRIVEKLKPKYVIWENVASLINKRNIHNFNAYISRMESMGYVNFANVMKSADYGIPQKRQRLFTISIRNGMFMFPDPEPLVRTALDFLDDVVEEKYYLTPRMKKYIQAENGKWVGNNNHCYINKTIASTINTGEGSRRCDASNFIAPSLPADYDIKGKDITCVPIRKMTPLECMRLQGFDDIDYALASKVCSDTQIIKQAGNSITVNVLQAILKNLIPEEYLK